MLRQHRGITQKELAKKAMVSLTRLNQVENNSWEVTSSFLKKICEALGVDVDAFLFATATIPGLLSERQKKLIKQVQESCVSYLLREREG